MSRSTINVHYLLISIFMQSFDFEYTAVKSSECPFSLNLCSQILSFLQAGNHILTLIARCHWQEAYFPE